MPTLKVKFAFMKLLIISFFIFSASQIFAQEPLAWTTDLKAAAEISIKENKPLFLYFTGSDWCGVCKRLQNEVFSQAQFQQWAKENVILVELDFPRNPPIDEELKKQNQMMKEFCGVSGYPTIVFVTPSKKGDHFYYTRIGSTGYVPGGADAWLNSAKAALAVK